MTRPVRIAWFVTPHGFGHAARSAAVVAALARQIPGLDLELWTSVPRWFFDESIDFRFRYRELACDVGLIQRSPVEEDLPATLAALERLAAEHRPEAIGAQLRQAGVDLVVCDIAPLGLAAARHAGIPSVLIENFTWDWIYEPLAEDEPGFAPWVRQVRERFALADFHLQLDPAGEPSAAAVAIPPVARAVRSSAAAVRRRLGVPPDDAFVLVSLGGIAHRLDHLEPLRAIRATTFVLPGAADAETSRGNLRLLPHRSPVFHPDLVAASDLVVGKLGYSTVAEAFAAGTRLLYVPREGFRESAVLERFVSTRLPARSIAFSELESGAWAERVPEMLRCPRARPETTSGAQVAAATLAKIAGDVVLARR